MKTSIIFGTTTAVITPGPARVPVDRFALAYSVKTPFGLQHWLRRVM